MFEEGGATRLRVVESGFAKLAAPPETRRKAWEGNTKGWAIVFDLLKGRMEETKV